MFWLVSMVVLFAAQGMLIRGIGAVTAVSYMLPYTFATMIFTGLPVTVTVTVIGSRQPPALYLPYAERARR